MARTQASGTKTKTVSQHRMSDQMPAMQGGHMMAGTEPETMMGAQRSTGKRMTPRKRTAKK